MVTRHTLSTFDHDLEGLRAEVLDLAAQVSAELDQAVAALVTGDRSVAQAVIQRDRVIDALHDKVSIHMTHVLARQHAVADDLRSILAAGRIAAHLERIGDYAKNTAKRSMRLKRPLDTVLAGQFRWMADRVCAMLGRVTEAFRERDADLANVAWTDDAELDAVYAKIFASLLALLDSDVREVEDGVQLLFIAKGLERCGDHVTDIAEEIYLKVTGQLLRGQRPKVDEAAALPRHSSSD